ncbi:MAG TPA: ATP-binding cassette domain-containing protein, partial [Chloroflexota bacterium]|nr:ATP-binding cassette domain-containing protein [Chloroflexota bacterium]
MTSVTTLLALEDVYVRYGGVQALRGVSLTVHAGEIVALLGPNGSGKTTTLRAISGLVAPSAG